MSAQHPTILNDPAVRAALRHAWQDSQPGIIGGHEEGGFVLRDSVGNLSVICWPRGGQGVIALPPHRSCKIGKHDIVATFHTHPNVGDDYLQEPSETDRRAVRDDPDLKGELYQGEFVVSQEVIYFIAPDGQVSEMGNTREILADW